MQNYFRGLYTTEPEAEPEVGEDARWFVEMRVTQRQ